MSLLALTERETYEAMWAVEDYAKTSPGEQLVQPFLEMSGAEARPKVTVLDAGCGSGKGALALQAKGFSVELADLTDAGLLDEAKSLPFHRLALWEDVRHKTHGDRFDYVYCCDVLEHIPTPFVMLVVQRLLDVARRGLFLSVALQGDNFGVWVGKPLHQTVMNFVQWRECLSAVGTVKECRDMLMNGVYYVVPR